MNGDVTGLPCGRPGQDMPCHAMPCHTLPRQARPRMPGASGLVEVSTGVLVRTVMLLLQASRTGKDDGVRAGPDWTD